jgi:TP901 family phage tail tape measure protein
VGVRTVSVKLLAEISGYISPMKAAIQSTKDLKAELSKAASENKLDAVASMATKAGLALSGGFLLATTAASRFEKQMSEVDAVTNASASELTKLSEAALQAGKATQYSATEAAAAEAELAKAGISTADILGGALDGALALAAAGQLDLAEAADVAAKAMNIFQLSGKDVGHVADVLAAAANKSATDVHELGFALKMGGLAAKNSGVGLEETVGTLAAFADNALAGSDAGTSFKQMLMMLQSPSDKAAGLMDELGISAYDAAGNFVGIAGLADVLRTKLGNLTQEQRNAALSTIFGSDAMRAATVLYDEGSKGIREYTAAVDDNGAAAETAKKKTDNLMGDIERLTGSLETLFIESGSGANGGLRLLVQGLGGIVDKVSNIPAPVLAAVVAITGLAGAGLLAFSAFVKARSSFADAMEELRNAGPVTARVATGLEVTTKWALRASVAFAALSVAGEALRAWTKPAATDINSLNDALARLGSTGEVTGELTRMFGDNLEDLGGDMAVASSSLGGFFRGIEDAIPLIEAINESVGMGWNEAADKFKDVDQSLADMVRSGNGEQAAKVFARLWEEAQKQGVSLDRLRELFPGYIDAAGEAAKQTAGQAAAAKEAKDNNIALAGAFGEAASEADGLKTAFDSLNGVMLSSREAERAVWDAIDGFREAMDKSNGSMDVHSEKGRAAAAALDKAAEAAALAAQRKLDETGSVVEANKAYQAYIDQLRITLGQAGLTKKQIDDLIGSIAAMPSSKTVDVNVKVNYEVYAAHTAAGIESKLSRMEQARGGIVHFARGGVESHVAQIAPAGAMRVWAEPETGGEAYIPKRGDSGRAMSILSEAAGWYGAQVVPQPQGWYGSASTSAPMGGGGWAGIDYRQLGRAVAGALREAPIQGVVTLDGDRVGQIQGRQAGIYQRGG